jgi:hypothetical protein
MLTKEMKLVLENIENRLVKIATQYRRLRAENIIAGRPVAYAGEDVRYWPEGFADLPSGQGVAVCGSFWDDAEVKGAPYIGLELVLGRFAGDEHELSHTIGRMSLYENGCWKAEGLFFGVRSFDNALNISERILLSPENVEGRIYDWINSAFDFRTDLNPKKTGSKAKVRLAA